MKQQMREMVGPHVLFLKWNAGITLGLFLLSRVCSMLAGAFDWRKLADFANTCEGLGFLSFIGFAWILKLKAEAHEEKQVRDALFSPRRDFSAGRFAAAFSHGGDRAGK